MKIATDDTIVYTAQYAPDNGVNRWGDYNELVLIAAREGKRRFFLKSRRGNNLKPLNPIDTLAVLENFFCEAASK